MELTFTKNSDNEYVAEFTATGDFNIHLEREKPSGFVVEQRTPDSGEYAKTFSMGTYEGYRIIDFDFGGLVYPKHIRVTSGVEVLKNVVTFNE